MSDKKFELSRRRVLAGLGTIGVASAGAGAGTMALFSDSETSSGNTVQAGTLDLEIDGGNAATTTVTVPNAKPGDSGVAYAKLDNTGSLDGSVDVSLGSPSVTQVNSSEARNSAMAGTFETAYGFGTNSGVYHSLMDDAGYERNLVTTIDDSGDPVSVDVQLPKALDASAGDNIAIGLDLDEDGYAETQVIVQPGNSNADAEGFLHKDSTAADGFWVSEATGAPDEVTNATYDETAGTISFDIPTSNLSAQNNQFGIGGQLRYNGEEPGSPGQNFVVNLTPGFGWAPGFNSHSGRYSTIDGSLRNLADVANVDLHFDADFGSDEDLSDSDSKYVADSAGEYTSHEQTPVAQGKPGRIAGEYESNESLASDATTYLVVEWELPTEAGNAIQGQELTFDIEVELNQEDSQ